MTISDAFPHASHFVGVLGSNMHDVPEDQPDAIGQALDDWLGRLA